MAFETTRCASTAASTDASQPKRPASTLNWWILLHPPLGGELSEPCLREEGRKAHLSVCFRRGRICFRIARFERRKTKSLCLLFLLFSAVSQRRNTLRCFSNSEWMKVSTTIAFQTNALENFSSRVFTVKGRLSQSMRSPPSPMCGGMCGGGHQELKQPMNVRTAHLISAQENSH